MSDVLILLFNSGWWSVMICVALGAIVAWCWRSRWFGAFQRWVGANPAFDRRSGFILSGWCAIWSAFIFSLGFAPVIPWDLQLVLRNLGLGALLALPILLIIISGGLYLKAGILGGLALLTWILTEVAARIYLYFVPSPIDMPAITALGIPLYLMLLLGVVLLIAGGFNSLFSRVTRYT